MTGFPQMRYEVVELFDEEPDQVVCLTDDEVSAAITFAKKVKDVSDNKEPGSYGAEFRDRQDKKFVRVTLEIGEME